MEGSRQNSAGPGHWAGMAFKTSRVSPRLSQPCFPKSRPRLIMTVSLEGITTAYCSRLPAVEQVSRGTSRRSSGGEQAVARQHGLSSYNLTINFPVFLPVNSKGSPVMADSRPSSTWARYLILPAMT